MISKLIHRLALLVLALGTLASCSINQDVSFNKDFSGQYAMKIDLSGAIGMLGEEGKDKMKPTGKDSVEIAEKIEALGQIEGITNVKMISENAVLGYTFDFANLDALNSAIAEQGFLKQSNPSMDRQQKFVRKGKTFKYEVPNRPNEGEEKESEELSAEMEQVMAMAKMMEVNFTFHFAQKVKKFDNKSAVLIDDGKGLKIAGTLEDLDNKSLQLGTEVKLK
ncbi:MAG: hypothetical protein AAGB22_06315 [Bacteroidota bacterium]